MFHCTHCDAQYPKWQGRCTQCSKWGTIEEEGGSKKSGGKPAVVLALSGAKKNQAKAEATGIAELDRVLGGGIVPGSVTLISGEPGIGKSTLIADLAARFGSKDAPSLYTSGEESEGQVLMRFERLKLDPKHLLFSNSTIVEDIIAASEQAKPSLLIIDSIQTASSAEADNLPGSITMVKAVTSKLVSFAKGSGIPVIIIGQITKDGSIAGPKTLEHLVDTLLHLEGDSQSSYRVLRALKHRFGSTEEVGMFEMTEAGLKDVQNPSSRFLEERQDIPGSAVTCILEGTRPVLVEIQALVDKSPYAQPVRRTSGFDNGRLGMLLAILSKRLKAQLGDKDVYINVVGGIKLKEHAADLAVCAAILSSLNEKTLPKNAVYFGEVGLGGEVRSVSMTTKRKKEAERLGLTQVFDPGSVKTIQELR
ncbi:MAG: DNA repair protein RadA [bacterium]|nr:DNA repair protein RadA [bacterium]MDA1024471.1 DNA repair protein RadA [bacterium]